jgi:hypothetical protein
MKLTFKGRPLTKARLGWWLRIFLTKLFGRKVNIEGRDEPLKILPWIHRGRLLLMGAEHDFLQVYFTNQYTTEIRSCPQVPPIRKARAQASTTGFVHTILCHQEPDVVVKIYDMHRALSSDKYHICIAYGGSRNNFERIEIKNKYFIEDPSLRGPTNQMSHYALLQRAAAFNRDRLDSFFVFTESDLVPLASGYLEELDELGKRYESDFLGKNIRDITASSNGFLADGVSRCIAGHKSRDAFIANLRYYHCIGCIFGVRGKFLEPMINYCKLLEGLYFEVMFPTAAIAAGCTPLSIDAVSDCLSTVRYRPHYTLADVQTARLKHRLLHPLKGRELICYLDRSTQRAANDSPSEP